MDIYEFRHWGTEGQSRFFFLSASVSLCPKMRAKRMFEIKNYKNIRYERKGNNLKEKNEIKEKI